MRTAEASARGDRRTAASGLASLALSLCTLLAALSASAQESQESLPIERFRPPVDNTGFGTTQGGGIADHLEFQGGFVTNYSLNPLVFRNSDGERDGAAIAHRVAGDLFFTFGLFDYVSFGLDLPLTFYQAPLLPQSEDILRLSGLENGVATVGLGDVRVVPKVRILREDEHYVSLALIPAFTLPTSTGLKLADGFGIDYGGSYLGSGPLAFSFLPEVALSSNFYGVRLAGNLQWRLRPQVNYLGLIPVGPDITARAGVGYDVAWAWERLELDETFPIPSLLFYAELFGATADRDPFGAVSYATNPRLLTGADDLTADEALAQNRIQLHNHLEGSVGVRYEIAWGIQVEASIGTGFLFSGYGSPDLRAYGGLRYAFERRDKDGDGIEDGDDACPKEAEDKDGYADSDGCPDPDNDGDGLIDAADRCPDEAEDEDGFEDGDGCPDLDNDEDGFEDPDDRCPDEKGPAETGGCPIRDQDEDGLSDEIDRCPSEPGPLDRDGCPVRDSDEDGLQDEEDECPNEKGPIARRGCPPKDRDLDGLEDADDECPDVPGPVERKGCPLGDKDLDGVLDDEDKCPAEKGPATNEGCPIPDTDGDGVVDDIDACPEEPGPVIFEGCPDTDGDGVEDRVDKCPEEAGLKVFDGCNDKDNDGVPDFADECPEKPEVINGVDDTDGCPDEGKRVVIVTREKIEIRERVFFNSGKATIQERSWPLLNQVAQVLQANAQIERVEVQGHTDAQGGDDYNRRLSQRRAEKVVEFLVAQGVEEDRLVPKGYGEEQPIAPNDTRAGRAKNRRVEFVILDQADAPPAGEESGAEAPAEGEPADEDAAEDAPAAEEPEGDAAAAAEPAEG